MESTDFCLQNRSLQIMISDISPDSVLARIALFFLQHVEVESDFFLTSLSAEMSKARITRLIEITTLKSVDLKKVTRLVSPLSLLSLPQVAAQLLRITALLITIY